MEGGRAWKSLVLEFFGNILERKKGTGDLLMAKLQDFLIFLNFWNVFFSNFLWIFTFLMFFGFIDYLALATRTKSSTPEGPPTRSRVK